MAASIPMSIGRYRLFDEIAAGGMATVHVGRMLGPAGFSRTVAIKRLHAQFVRDPEFVAMLLDEARLAARIQHPNVASTLNVVEQRGEVFLVMELLRGESLAKLAQAAKARGERVPPAVAVAAVVHALHGLHAAHEAKGEGGAPLEIVHRDVSPQNLFVGADGVTRVLDFGIAKAQNRLQSTREGQLKGKLRYMSPEQVQRWPVDRRTDVYAASMVLWEALTGERLFAADDAGGVVDAILHEAVAPPSQLAPGLPAALDVVVLRGLARSPDQRFASALELADALEDALAPAKGRDVRAWVERLAAEALHEADARVAAIERHDEPDASAKAEEAPTQPVGTAARALAKVESTTVPVGPAAARALAETSSTDAQLVTDASARTSPARARRAPVVPKLALAGLAVAFAAAATFAVARRVGGAAPVEAAAEPRPAASAPLAPAAPSPSAAAAAIEPPASSSSAAEAAAPAPPEASSDAAATAAPAPSAAPRSPRARPLAPKAAAKPGCERPYKIVDGIKQWKPECI